MLFVARMFVAWILAILGSALIATIIGQGPASKGDLTEGILGIGLIIGLPMLIFAALIALPLSFYLTNIRPNWLSGICAALIFAGVAAALSMAIFPSGWKGAAQALIIFSALLGLFWGLTGYVMTRSPAAG